jgi:hypothetical protein
MDTEGPHEHAQAPHRTGFRWLDISLALSAFFIGLISLTDVRVCYCSVFDECYVHDSRRTEPGRIESCPVPAVPYTDE